MVAMRAGWMEQQLVELRAHSTVARMARTSAGWKVEWTVDKWGSPAAVHSVESKALLLVGVKEDSSAVQMVDLLVVPRVDH